ncbi:MAG: hypothetical protein AB1564_17175, partial [Chloroflexota bacterium]
MPFATNALDYSTTAQLQIQNPKSEGGLDTPRRARGYSTTGWSHTMSLKDIFFKQAEKTLKAFPG